MTRVKRTLLAALLVGLMATGAMALAVYMVRTTTVEEEDRGMQMYRFGLGSVVGGTLKCRDGVIVFEKREEGWWMTEPTQWRLSKKAIEDVIVRMTSLRATDVTEADEDAMQEYGLAEPSARLELRVQDGSKHALVIGSENKVEKSYFVMKERSGRVSLAKDTFFWAYDKTVSEFRSALVLEDRPIQDLLGLRVESPEGLLFALGRTDSGALEVVDKEEKYPADPLLVERVLALFRRDLRAESFETDAYEPKDAAKFGLDEPKLRLALKFVDGEVGLSVGQIDKGGTYVHNTATTSVLGVYDGFVRDMQLNADHFRDRRVANFDPERVHSIFIRLSESEAKLRRTRRSWKMLDPRDRPGKKYLIDNLLLRLSKLRSHDVHREAPTAEERRAAGLDPAVRELDLRDAEGKRVARILVGNAYDEKRLFIGAESLKRIDLIDAASIAFIPEHVVEMIDDGV